MARTAARECFMHPGRYEGTAHREQNSWHMHGCTALGSHAILNLHLLLGRPVRRSCSHRARHVLDTVLKMEVERIGGRRSCRLEGGD